jgi:hypothetical protein
VYYFTVVYSENQAGDTDKYTLFAERRSVIHSCILSESHPLIANGEDKIAE